MTTPVGYSYSMAKSLKNIFETRLINYDTLIYENITEKYEVDEFMMNVVVSQIYNEDIKEFPPMVDSYHYLNYFNYFAGMRLTHNRVVTEVNNVHLTTELPKKRKRNYQGTTDKTFYDVKTDQFGYFWPTNYTKIGGFASKGGYVNYFPSGWDFDTALDNYNSLFFDNLFGSDLLSVTLEIMFYNENYQTGTILIYEFMFNNVGFIEKYKDVESFYLSRYSSKYRNYSYSLCNFLLLLDIIYL